MPQPWRQIWLGVSPSLLSPDTLHTGATHNYLPILYMHCAEKRIHTREHAILLIL